MLNQPAPVEDDVATLERLLARRYSCRGFLPDPVPRPVIERILSSAQRTPSWCNSQPWQVVVTESAATDRLREALYAHAVGGGAAGSDLPWPREYRGVYLQRRRESGFGLYNALGIARDDMAGRERQSLENYRFFGAPHVAIITSDEALGPYGAVDCGAYVSTFLLAAEAHGLGAIPQAALAHHSAFLRNWFGLGDDRLVICGISFGYADPEAPANRFRTSRAALGDAVRFVGD